MQFLGYSFIHDEDSFLYNNVSIDENIDTIELSDAQFYLIFISTNVTSPYPTTWDDDTVMFTTFDNTCNANRSKIDLNTIDGLVLKKLNMRNPKAKWETIYTHSVNKESDVEFEYIDYFCRNNSEYKYNIIPIANGIESYINNETLVKSSFDGVYFTDGKVQYGTAYDIDSKYSRKTSSSILTPINSKYLTSIKNGNLNYWTGNITARFLKINCDTHDEDLENNFYYQNELTDFLTQNSALVFKNQDGLMAIISIEEEISFDTSEYYLIPKITFSWDQIGDADNYEELLDCGLVDGDNYVYR